MNARLSIMKQPLHQHLFFWLIVLCCYGIANWEFHNGLEEVMITYIAKVVLHAMVAYAFLIWIIPRYLADKNKWKLISRGIIILLLLQVLVINWRYHYLFPTYPLTYADCIAGNADLGYWGLLFNISFIFFKNPAIYFPPALVLIAIQYYQTLQKDAEVKEQKRTQELNALKHQLNPHFLFNTLNNLYALALKKSDKTPEVIGKLSDIMDYLLYRCGEKYVPLNKEVELLENYLALEKIRYGSRVSTNFIAQVEHDVLIAPLLLLTFIENAFKHGVKQEIQQADINIELYVKEHEINFHICNTIPETKPFDRMEKGAIGLSNVRQQLQLLYPSAHDLKTIDHGNSYEVHLKLQPI